MNRILFLVLIYTGLLLANKFSDINIVFVNGIQNSEEKARESAETLSLAIGQSKHKTIKIYNTSRNFFEDIFETYAYAKYDGTNGGKDFTPFWQAIDSHERSGTALAKNKKFQNMYLQNIRDGFLKYGGDYISVYDKIKAIRDSLPESNKKMLILSHSEGTLVANLVMKRLEEEYGESAKECTGLVSIATPVSTAVGIRNNGLYTTSDNDIVIGAIRPDVGSLASNFDGVYDPFNDFLGHGLLEIYLNRGNFENALGERYRPNHAIRTRIINQINTMADRLNENCKPKECTDTKIKGQIATAREWLFDRTHCVMFSSLTGARFPKNIWKHNYSGSCPWSGYKNAIIIRDKDTDYSKFYAGELIDYFNDEIYHLDSGGNSDDTYSASVQPNHYYIDNSFNVGFTIVQYKNGDYYRTINLTNLLSFEWFDGSSHVGYHHYDTWCNSNNSLCSYLKNNVRGDSYDEIGYYGLDWIIGEYNVPNFVNHISNALATRYSQSSEPNASDQYPEDWLKRIVDWIEAYDCSSSNKMSKNIFYDEAAIQEKRMMKGLQ